MSKTSTWIVALVVAALAIAAGAYFWTHRQAPVAPATEPPVAEVAPAVAEPASVAASEPPLHYPIPASAAGSQAAATAPSIESALTDLIGRQALLSMFQTHDFARRFVATVDNLGRSHASTTLWPVNPTPGRLLVEKKDGGGEALSADNGARYTPFVQMMESLDLNKAVALYARFYPQLQQSYEDIGFPNRYFNDRLVAVIDQLLATPDLSEPAKIHLPPINGPVRPERPWVLYEFDDPALQSLSSGQRILLRTGPDNERRLKLRLAEVRRLVTGGGGQKP